MGRGFKSLRARFLFSIDNYYLGYIYSSRYADSATAMLSLVKTGRVDVNLNTVAGLSEQNVIALLWFEQLKFLNRPQRVIKSKSIKPIEENQRVRSDANKHP
ncbi:hypothetical protein GNF10_34480 [Nostoc sp. UCD121]|uniref:hypothetical protein n=1 Tax=unclassified Nostoc TaxID=2593658 RepID=UPI0016270EB7|nr:MULTISPECIES: hypothetical protein [unclassified Nostoc]MBC1224185.1 hypothetical protein [Nostoc sp. UCD120]MBC1280905.1 hypothetical protein [Nostoc sp. UCD121]MBC1299037.1 hypothetical protein [Nostoc sp. UCD122]